MLPLLSKVFGVLANLLCVFGCLHVCTFECFAIVPFLLSITSLSEQNKTKYRRVVLLPDSLYKKLIVSRPVCVSGST